MSTPDSDIVAHAWVVTTVPVPNIYTTLYPGECDVASLTNDETVWLVLDRHHSIQLFHNLQLTNMNTPD